MKDKVKVGLHDNDPTAQYLHLLVHANNKGPNLCKTVISAGALNYPIPSILSWKAEYNNSNAVDNGAEIKRIESISEYIDTTFRKYGHRDEDVAIILDGYDTWFQLRPDIMLERFFEANRLANNRVVKKMGQVAMDAGRVQQKIIFGKQQECSGKKEDPACWAVPQSPLSKNVYGAGKDGERFLNAGFIMGELGALRRLFNKANETFHLDEDHNTLQSVMTKMFGEQEYEREVLALKYQPTSLLSRLARFIGFSESSSLAQQPLDFQPQAIEAGAAEYNIGLDYDSLLTSSTELGDSLEFISRTDTKHIASIKRKAKFTISDKVYKLSDDILRSLEPFWSRNPSKTLPRDSSWESTPLFTNLHTGAIPASIQHSSPRLDPDNPSNLRISSWSKLWFHQHVRELLDEHIEEPYRSFATLEGGESGEVAWWPLHMRKWGFHDPQGEKIKKQWIDWQDVCGGDGELEKEVWRDGKPAWKPSRMDY